MGMRGVYCRDKLKVAGSTSPIINAPLPSTPPKHMENTSSMVPAPANYRKQYMCNDMVGDVNHDIACC